MTLLSIVLLLSVAGLVFFFSSDKAQTALANSLSNQINSSFDTSIEIGRAKIDIKGNVQLYSFLIRDHRADTLFFVEEFKVKLLELEEVFQQTYRFSALKITQPLLNIVTYKEEEQSNLNQFIQKLNRKNSTKTDFYGTIDELFLYNGKIVFDNKNTKRKEVLSQLELHLNNTAFASDSLISKIDSISFRNKGISTPIKLASQLSYSSNRLKLDNTVLKLLDGYLAGALELDFIKTKNINFFEDVEVDLKLSEGQLPIELFRFTNPMAYPKKTFSISGSAKGKLNDLASTLKLQLSPDSFINANLLLKRDKDQQWILRSDKLNSSITKSDFKKLPISIKGNSSWVAKLAMNKLAVDGRFVYVLDKRLDASAKFRHSKNTLQTDITLIKTADHWQMDQQLNFSCQSFDQLFFNSPIDFIEGNGRVNGVLRNQLIAKYELDFKLSSLGQGKMRLQNIVLNGMKNEDINKLFVKVNDDRMQFDIDANQTNDPAAKLIINSHLKKIDLSALGLSPKVSDVQLAADLMIEANSGDLVSLTAKNVSILNRKQLNDFRDFEIKFEHKGDEKHVYQSGSDFFDFNMIGKFDFEKLPQLFTQAVEEAFLISKKNKFKSDQYFSFDLSFNEKIIESLYPSLESPDQIEFKGFISSKPKASSFSIDLPYLNYKAYRFEGLSLNAQVNTKDYLTHFTANRMYAGALEVVDFDLSTKDNAGELSVDITGLFGNSNNPFVLSMDYSEAENNSILSFKNMEVVVGENHWLLDENNTHLVYNTIKKSISLRDFVFQANDQSLELAFDYRSNEEFNFDIKTANFNLGDALPESEKFNFEGILNGDIRFVKGKPEMSANGSLNVSSLAINQVPMGDLTFAITGSPQFNTYSLTTLLNQEGANRLKGSGSLFIPKQGPNVNMDFQLNNFDISFLSRLGKGKITQAKGKLSGELNLWGELADLKLAGQGILDDAGMFFPAINIGYKIAQRTPIRFRDNTIDFINGRLIEPTTSTEAVFNGGLSHVNFKAWEMDLRLATNRLLVYNRTDTPDYLFYGKGFLSGNAHFLGPTKSLTLKVEGSSSEGSTLVIPWRENKGISDTSFIDFIPKGSVLNETVSTEISEFDESFRGFEMVFDLDINRNAALEIVVDQTSGSTLSGRGSGNILIETNTDGKFNIWGDFITYDGTYNFKNLGLIDKKFAVKQGGTIVWEGDPLEAQMNIEATYQVPGGANPALLVDNPNFNRKIPTEVNIQLVGNLIKPDDPVFEITFPNTTGIVASEINYRLADQQRRQLQALSLLSQGIFISDVSVSFQGITNNLYEKASDVFSTILGSNEGKLNVGLNYLQGEENPTIDLQTEDRIGLTLSTQISDRILINGKIGVPIDGVEETVIVGDVQIDFILNEKGSLKAKVFNRENEFRYLGDQLGYTQGMGMSYQVDFNTFQELIRKIKKREEIAD